MAESRSDSAILCLGVARQKPKHATALRQRSPLVYQIAAPGAPCRGGAVSVWAVRAVHVFLERL
jgi:hypothetical protein